MAETTNDGGRGGLYAMLAIIIFLIIIAIVLFLPRGDTNGTRDIDADIRIEAPDVTDRNGGGDGGNGDGG